MSRVNLIDRARKILLDPKSEWPRIATESTSIKDLYVPYVVVLAAIPAVAGFIKGSLIGYSAFGMHVRTPVMSGLAGMIISYALSLVLLYVMAWIINALATTFNAEKNLVQAFKSACFAWTAAWVAGVGTLVPWLGWLIAIAGSVYSIYLLYLGLPHTMKCPREKAAGYTAVSVIIAVVLSFVLAMVVGGVVGLGAAGQAALGGSSVSQGGSNVQFDEDSQLGKLVALGKRMEEVGKQVEQAEQTEAGNSPQSSEAQMKALAAAMSGGKDGKPVPALAADQLKTFLPETLAGLQRASLSSERQAAMGMEVSNATARYRNPDGSVDVEVQLMDMPSLAAGMAFANAFAQESESRNATGFEKTYLQDGSRIVEKWNNKSEEGEYSMTLEGRFRISVAGHADSMETLKRIALAVDRDGMKQAGQVGEG